MALTPEQKQQLAALEKPLGQILYAVAPYDSLARELQRVGVSLQRNLEAAKKGNTEMKAGLADMRNDVIPVELEDRAADEFRVSMQRTVGALNRTLDEFTNATELCVQIAQPEVKQAVAQATAFKTEMDTILKAITPVLPPSEPEPEPEPEPTDIQSIGLGDNTDAISGKDSGDR